MKRSVYVFPLSFHENGLNNMREILRAEEMALARMRERIDRLRADIDRRAEQIAEARRRGLTEFDPERFLKTRPGKG